MERVLLYSLKASKLVVGKTKGFLRGKALSVEGHTHSASNITSGTLPIARGGTNITSNPSCLVNLASTSAASLFATSPRPGVTGILPITKGGTGATSASAARSALGAAAASHTHTISEVTSLQSELNSLKTSVSNGKSAVASAITDKGVSTSATATFDTMAANIRAISSLKSETRVIEHVITWPNQEDCYRVDITFSYNPVLVLVHYPNVEHEMGCQYFYLEQGVRVTVKIKSPGMSWDAYSPFECLLSGNTAYVCHWSDTGNLTHIGESTINVTFKAYYQ